MPIVTRPPLLHMHFFLAWMLIYLLLHRGKDLPSPSGSGEKGAFVEGTLCEDDGAGIVKYHLQSGRVSLPQANGIPLNYVASVSYSRFLVQH